MLAHPKPVRNLADRIDKRNREFLQKALTAFLGKNAFAYAVRGEKFAQTAVAAAKSTIVVKSVIVPVFNALSTMKQLMMWGIGPRTIARDYPTKLVEIEQHLKNLDRQVEINAEITANRGDKTQVSRLQAELKSIEESSKRMSIWPLIEAGEFMTISEGMTEADAALVKGRWAEYVANVIERIPQKLGTVGRWFQGQHHPAGLESWKSMVAADCSCIARAPPLPSPSGSLSLAGQGRPRFSNHKRQNLT